MLLSKTLILIVRYLRLMIIVRYRIGLEAGNDHDIELDQVKAIHEKFSRTLKY